MPSRMPSRVAVAYSGGRDSTALLHATVAAAEPLGVQVTALHVHHGLSAHADEWLSHAQAFCAAMAGQGAALEFVATRIATRPARGESIEAWARTARYAALRKMALTSGANLVLLAHHRRDQAETLLLQALRGAGPAGLAGMPRSVERGGVTWARPWLGRPREAIEAYVTRHRLAHIDDDSNVDTRYARNRLRAGVWPALVAAHPEAEGSLARAASWAQEAAAALQELAAIDLTASASPTHAERIDLASWRRLSAARRSNVLRAWLRQRTGRAAASTLVLRLMDELASDHSARWPLTVGELQSHGGALAFASSRRDPAEGADRDAASLRVTRAGTRRVAGWHGALRFERVASGGVALARLHALVLRAREGGEQFQAGAGRPPRALKKQFQALGINAWERDGPIVWSGGELLFVPGLGIDHRMLASAGEPQMTMTWLPEAPL